MEWYPWLNTVYSQILYSYSVERGHHFLLIQSKRDNGLDSLIYAVSRWLMCFSPVGIKSCNQCHGCRLMKSLCHPDYYCLEPEMHVQSIGIDKIRVLVEKLYQYAYVSNLKIVYIKSSEYLTEEAVSALLKIFEEPPAGVYFFLGCKDFAHLLPTFLSRCLRWNLIIPEEKISLKWLYKKGIMNSIETIAALRLCGGAPLEAYSVLMSDFWKLRLLLCNKLIDSIDGNNFLLSILSVLTEDKEKDKKLISWLYSLFIDSLKWNRGVRDFLINVDQINLIRYISIKFSSRVLNSQLEQWLIFLRYWDSIIYINHKFLLFYQLLNIEGNVLNFIP